MTPDRAWPFLSDPRAPLLSAAWAVLMHGALGVLVIAPIILASRRRRLCALLAFVGAVAVDLDHVVAASSVSPRAMEHLARRPDTHTLALALALGLLALALTRRLLAAWAVFAVVASHLITDAAGGGDLLLYPLREPEAIPWLACPLGILALTAISWALARRDSPGRRDAREPAGITPGLASPPAPTAKATE